MKVFRSHKFNLTYSSVIQNVGGILKNQIHIAGISKSDESKTSRPARLWILHDYTIHYLAILAEVSHEGIMAGFPTQPSNKHFPVNNR